MSSESSNMGSSQAAGKGVSSCSGVKIHDIGIVKGMDEGVDP